MAKVQKLTSKNKEIMEKKGSGIREIVSEQNRLECFTKKKNVWQLPGLIN